MDEIWRDINGYNGIYQVSNFGNIKSLRFGKVKILKQKIAIGRYKQVTLSKNGKIHTYFVHRLVASAFLSKTNDNDVVNHKDNNGLNNNVNNLEWCSQKYNVIHAWGNGFNENVRKKAHYSKGRNKQLNNEQIKYIKDNYKAWDKEYGSLALAKKFNVSRMTIRNYMKG